MRYQQHHCYHSVFTIFTGCYMLSYPLWFVPNFFFVSLALSQHSADWVPSTKSNLTFLIRVRFSSVFFLSIPSWKRKCKRVLPSSVIQWQHIYVSIPKFLRFFFGSFSLIWHLTSTSSFSFDFVLIILFNFYMCSFLFFYFLAR